MEPKWIKIESEKGYPFTDEISLNNSKNLLEIIGNRFFIDQKNRHHDLVWKWNNSSKSSNLFFNALALDLDLLKNVPGISCVLHDLKNRDAFEGALHTIRSAAMFARVGNCVKEFFESKNNKVPDYSIISSGKEILVENKFLQESVFRKNFSKSTSGLIEEIETKCPEIKGFPAHISVVMKDSENIPSSNEIIKDIKEIVKILKDKSEIITGKDFNNATIKNNIFNIIATDRAEEAKFWDEYRSVSIYCSRNDKENLKLLRVVKEANGQIKGKSQRKLPGILIVGIGKHQDPYIINSVISKEFSKSNFRNVSLMMLLRTTFIVQPEVSTIDNEMGLVSNNNSYQKLDQINLRPLGGLRPMFKDPPKNAVSAYEISQTTGRVKASNAEAMLTIPIIGGLQRWMLD